VKAVLIDTVVLYALVDPDDQHHLAASKQARQLDDDGLSAVVPYPILLETHALVLRWLGTSACQRWLAEVRESVAFVNAAARHYDAAAALNGRYRDQAISLYDLTLAVLAEELDLPVWSYDRHFDVLGVPTWPDLRSARRPPGRRRAPYPGRGT
jgi:predicted nucleic acid-binding protein